MPFKKDNKLAKGGKREGAGRHSNEKKKVLEAAADIAKGFIEENIKPVLKVYLQLAGGREVKHYNQQSGDHIYTENEVDTPTLRHYVDRLVAPAKQEIEVKADLSLTINIIDYANRDNPST